MKNKIKVCVLVIFSMLVIHGSAFSAVKVGETPQDFTLTDSAGASHTLSEYRGKHVVLEWLNHDCPFVKKHYNSGNMQSLQKEFTAKDIIWLSINSSAPGKQGHCSAEEAQEITETKEAKPTAVLLDPDGKVGKAYGAKTTPHMYIVDPKGVLVYQGAIDSISSADPADISEAENYVKLALEESLSGKSISIPMTKSYGCSVKY